MQLRQLEFTFDYEEAGIAKKDATALEKDAVALERGFESARVNTIKGAMAVARKFASAKKRFQSGDFEEKWPDWVKARLGASKSAADKACKVHEVFGSTDIAVLAGLPPSRLYKLAQDKHDAQRDRILKLAETRALDPLDVDRELAGSNGKSGEVSFRPNVPQDHQELRDHLDKKLTNLEKRLPDEVADEIPDVLRELAEAWEEAA